MPESYKEWSKRVYAGTEFEHIGNEVIEIRAARHEKKLKQLKLQKSFFFRAGHFLRLPGFEYKERNI